MLLAFRFSSISPIRTQEQCAMTRQEAKKRRQQIAKAMQKVQNISDVAIEFGVSEDLVRRACREFGTKASSRGAKASKPEKVNDQSVIAELRTGKSPTDVADRYDMPVVNVVRLQKRVASGLPAGKTR
jgi:transposase-like protein